MRPREQIVDDARLGTPFQEFLEFTPNVVKRRDDKVLRKALLIILERCEGDLASFLEHARANGGNDLHKYIQHLINRLTEQGAKPHTILYYLALIRKFLKFHDVDVSRAFKKISKPRRGVVRLDLLPDVAMLQRMIYATKSERLRLLIQLLAQTGLRLNEALQLRRSHIDLEGGWIYLPGTITKSGRPRSVPIISELREALRLYIERHAIPPDGLLFPNERNPSVPWTSRLVYRDWHMLIRRLGLDQRDEVGFRLHPHCLRKFFKTRLELADVNGLLIMSWMGHSTGIHATYFLPRPQDIAKEVEKAERALTIFGHVMVDAEAVRGLEGKVASLEELVRLLMARIIAVGAFPEDDPNYIPPGNAETVDRPSIPRPSIQSEPLRPTVFVDLDKRPRQRRKGNLPSSANSIF